VLHADYSLVTQSNPAKAGETLQLYLTGLGSVTPSVADGAAASTTTLSMVDEQVAVYVGGLTSKIAFAGLAPGFAGLYQINFVVPGGITTGISNYLIIVTPDGETAEAKLYT
jgi:adhesin/invasin